jgi:hypothetical protein
MEQRATSVFSFQIFPFAREWTVWRVQQSRADGWAKLRILAPGNSESEKASFTVTC